MHGKGFPWHRCQQGSPLRRKAKPASACYTKGGWHREENSAGSSRLGSLRALWSLYLGKIGVEEGGAEKADAQQRDSKWEGNVLRAVRFCCGFAKQERQPTAGLPAAPSFPLRWVIRNPISWGLFLPSALERTCCTCAACLWKEM